MNSACCQLLDSLREANLTGTVPFADLSSLETELVLVSMFVLRGVNAIRIALQTVPSELPLEHSCLLYTSPSPRDATLSRMPSSA